MHWKARVSRSGENERRGIAVFYRVHQGMNCNGCINATPVSVPYRASPSLETFRIQSNIELLFCFWSTHIFEKRIYSIFFQLFTPKVVRGIVLRVYHMLTYSARHTNFKFREISVFG
eukprot:sb/3476560/